MKQTLLMIRPLQKAKAFVADLGQAADAFDLMFDPIIAIQFLPATLPPPDARAFVFTSANGVAAYARQHQPAGQRAYCVNETTGAFARSAGFDPVIGTAGAAGLVDLIDADRVTYIRAKRVSFDLVGALSAKGTTCDEYVGYRQTGTNLSARSVQTLAQQRVVLPVFSDFAAQTLLSQIDASTAPALTPLCISDAVASNFRRRGFNHIVTADTPNRAGLVARLAEIARTER